MEELIDIQIVKKKKQKVQFEKFLKEFKRFEISQGYVRKKDGRNFILQGVNPPYRIPEDEKTINFNNYKYSVNNGLIIEGWIPSVSIPIDQDYFVKRKRILSDLSYLETREEKSKYFENGKPCIVIYRKD
jgi:hypothetical protein